MSYIRLIWAYLPKRQEFSNLSEGFLFWEKSKLEDELGLCVWPKLSEDPLY